jgi:ATP-dependent DNA helicase RecQ
LVRIFWNDAYSKLKIDSDTLQKAIYRLSLLGIASDWTTNFVNHYEVRFSTLNENQIIKSISNYITKYEPNTDVQFELNQIEQNTILEKSIWYLLNWTFENIAYSRKQSLKTLSDWCSEFQDSESFKERIDSYFIFSETVFVLQHIAENPKEYEKWFEVLTTNNQFPNKAEFEKLRDSISRFLESYRNNLGLNFLSGFVRLALNDYNDSDGKERFESCLSTIKSNLEQDNKDDFLSRLKILGKNLSEEQKMELSQSIAKYYPELLEELAEYYDLAYLLNDVYSQKLQELKKLNKKLYEQLAEI